jgi:hypothetical protein
VETEVEREPVSAVIGLLFGLPLMFASVALMHFSSESPSAGTENLSSTTRSLMTLGGVICAVGAATGFVYHFRSVLQQRILLLATIVTILMYAGNVIPSNMNLYSEQVLGNIPEKYAGVQNMLRFGFKVIAGTVLGWLLTRTSPRAGLLATGLIFLGAQLWAIFVTGPWYLVAFGIHGAGELVGVYAPNYIVSASRRDELRRNMAFMTMMMVPAAPAGYLYGALVDAARQSNWTALGMNSTAFGFRLSFIVCGTFILSGIIMALYCLPAKPRPQSPGPEELPKG